jgi:hypothetical protein
MMIVKVLVVVPWASGPAAMDSKTNDYYEEAIPSMFSVAAFVGATVESPWCAVETTTTTTTAVESLSVTKC